MVKFVGILQLASTENQLTLPGPAIAIDPRIPGGGKY